MRTAAILPVKRFAAAKQRLRDSVADPLRATLAEAMVRDVLNALARTPSVELTIVVTAEERAAVAASDLGAEVIVDREESGQSPAAAMGLLRAAGDGIERVLCVPGDCPALDPNELQGLLARDASAGAGPRAVIVPDRHGTGTNALLLSPPSAIAPSFGPGSFERHRSLAASAGAEVRVERPPSLLLDIDTGADLAVLRELLASTSTGAARTRAVLRGDRDASLAAARR
jgi:2-phospho-L-lactate guanylyltransferase